MIFFNFKIHLRVTRSTVSYAWAKGLDQPDVSIPSVFIALSAGRLLRTILSSQPGRGGGGGGGGGGDGGELVVTILPTRGLAQDWPSLLASAFIASVAVMVVLSTLFFLRHRNSPFGIIAGGTGAAAAAAAAAGGSRRSAGHPRLLTSSEVARIPVTYFSSETSHADEDGTHETCAVCLEDYEDGEELRGLVCGHQFHQPCVDPWLMTKRANCPVCKHVIRPPPSDTHSQEEEEEEEEEEERQSERRVRRRRRRRLQRLTEGEGQGDGASAEETLGAIDDAAGAHDDENEDDEDDEDEEVGEEQTATTSLITRAVSSSSSSSSSASSSADVRDDPDSITAPLLARDSQSGGGREDEVRVDVDAEVREEEEEEEEREQTGREGGRGRGTGTGTGTGTGGGDHLRSWFSRHFSSRRQDEGEEGAAGARGSTNV